jgi:hypothetical protein
MSAWFAGVRTAAITWDAVHTLLNLLGISDRHKFHQCPMECMFNFDNVPDIKTVSNAAAYLGDTVPGTLYLNKGGCFSIGSLWRQRILRVFIKYQIMFYILKFPYWNPSDPDIWPWFYWSSYNLSPFHVMWVVGLEVLITTCMNRIPVHFHG